MADMIQWVNLKRDKKFVEDEVKTIERAGPVHFECKLNKGGKAKFLKVRIKAVSTPNSYTNTEETRNSHFKLISKRQVSNHSKKKFKVEEDNYLPAAGGNTYQIEAKVKRKVLQSKKTVETQRKLYYQPVHMAGITVPNMSSMETDYKAHHIILKQKDGAKQVAFVKNTDSDSVPDRINVVKSAAKGYTLDRYEPYTVCAFFVNMIASKDWKNFGIHKSPKFKLWPGLLAWFGTTLEYTVPDGFYLWWGVNDTDDAKNAGKGIWLYPNSAYYYGDDGKKHSISDNQISIDKSHTRTALGGHNRLKIKLPWGARQFWSPNTITVGITLRIVAGFAGGYSEPGVNLITIANQGWWVKNSDAKRLQILNHELGHKIGMVPDGTGKKLDKPTGHYTGKDHQGPHCENGANYNVALKKNKWQGKPKCVMFGATSCYDPTVKKHRNTTSKYCSDCEKLVKKLDLYAPDLGGLNNSVKKGTI